MRVLVACEFSGIVRDAFIARGHEAVSCDLLPSERPGPHIVGDVIEEIYKPDWDLLIAFPPCTYLCNSGVRWLYGGKGTVRDQSRWVEMNKACQFYANLINCQIKRKAIENPIMHRHATEILQRICLRFPEPQYIHPWQFGHGETKTTGLRLIDLPPLVPTNIVTDRKPRVHFASPGPNRWKERSRTLSGIAAAMAEQWSASA